MKNRIKFGIGTIVIAVVLTFNGVTAKSNNSANQNFNATSVAQTKAASPVFDCCYSDRYGCVNSFCSTNLCHPAFC
jgi:hypothetical protein